MIDKINNGTPWTDESNIINKISITSVDILCYRFKKKQSQNEILKKGVPEKQKILELIEKTKISVNLVIWII